MTKMTILCVVCVLRICFVSDAAEEPASGKVTAFKRYLFTCDLVDETDAVKGFKKMLEQDEWKSVCKTFRESGARDLEIYVFQDRVLAILETTTDFDLGRLEAELGMSEAYSEWEAGAKHFLKRVDGAEGDALWILLDRVYKLDQKREYRKEQGYVQELLKVPTRRMVEARELVDDPAEVARYESLHAMGKAWPEITQGLKDIGIVDNEIYSVGNRTFEFYEVTKEFDWEKSWEALESRQVSQEWGELVGPIDRPFTDRDGKPLSNQIMKRIFKLGKQLAGRATTTAQ
jgi:L-rhamnose mutarotase